MLEIIPSPSLSAMTTLRIGGHAVAELRLHNVADCDALLAELARLGGASMVRIIGGGSNLLVAEGELPLLLVNALVGATSKPELVREETAATGEHVAHVRAGAGQSMPSLLAWCAKRGFSGLEGLVGVPGRLGGAVAMNAGAYGCSVGPRLHSLTVFTPERGVETLGEKDWVATYRHFSLVQNCAWFVVLDAVLALPIQTPETVHSTMRTNIIAKKSTQPLNERTAGCVFKNPEGLSAGQLLDKAGFRGRREGAVYFSTKHANFLGHDRLHCEKLIRNATSSQGSFEAAATLIAQAREAVNRQSGINLELEVKVWPCPLF